MKTMTHNFGKASWETILNNYKMLVQENKELRAENKELKEKLNDKAEDKKN